MADQALVQQLVEEVLRRLDPASIWTMTQGCRTVCIEKDAAGVRYIVECGAARVGVKAQGSAGSELARYIDHTLLRANASQGEIEALCDEALEYGFASVCVNPFWVRTVEKKLRASAVQVCTVVGFPLGSNVAEVKVYEARRAIFDGATEIDMVLNVGALKSGIDSAVRDDIAGVVAACHENEALCKVILETAYLTDEEKVKACTFAKQAGADFVKTSTGFGPGGATPEDVALMRRVVGPEVGVKASGGIRDTAGTKTMLQAGATRIGASAGVKIVQGSAAEAEGRY